MGSRRDPVTGKTRRGCSNGNDRGNTKARRQRKGWLLETYPANRRLIRAKFTYSDEVFVDAFVLSVEQMREHSSVEWAEEVPTTRCYRCGILLWWETLTVDCIFPRALGGLYGTVLRDRREKRTNLRPACGNCNSLTGGPLAKVAKGKVAKTQKAAA